MSCEWGSVIAGAGCPSGLKVLGEAQHPKNFNAFIAANNAVSGVDFSVDTASAHASVETAGRGR